MILCDSSARRAGPPRRPGRLPAPLWISCYNLVSTQDVLTNLRTSDRPASHIALPRWGLTLS
jgi:hypothetical protein